MSKKCHECGEEWEDKRSPGFREECLKCESPLHCCANCRFYEGSASQWCREPQARDMRPTDVTASNTCEYFVFGEKKTQDDREQKAKDGLAAMFGQDALPKKKDKPDWA